MRFTRPTGCFCGSKAWAEAHATRLQTEVGTVADGMTVSAVRALPYGSSKRKWGVAPTRHYTGNPGLGDFTGEFYFLPI